MGCDVQASWIVDDSDKENDGDDDLEEGSMRAESTSEHGDEEGSVLSADDEMSYQRGVPSPKAESVWDEDEDDQSEMMVRDCPFYHAWSSTKMAFLHVDVQVWSHLYAAFEWKNILTISEESFWVGTPNALFGIVLFECSTLFSFESVILDIELSFRMVRNFHQSKGTKKYGGSEQLTGATKASEIIVATLLISFS